MTHLARAANRALSMARAISAEDPVQVTEPTSSWQTNLRQAAADMARRVPPMTAEQATVVRRALRKPPR